MHCISEQCNISNNSNRQRLLLFNWPLYFYTFYKNNYVTRPHLWLLTSTITRTTSFTTAATASTWTISILTVTTLVSLSLVLNTEDDSLVRSSHCLVPDVYVLGLCPAELTTVGSCLTICMSYRVSATKTGFSTDHLNTMVSGITVWTVIPEESVLFLRWPKSWAWQGCGAI